MKKQIVVLAMILFSQYCFSQVYVPAKIKKDGTYRGGYYKTKKNSKTSDNYSTDGNYNPYTGKQGSKRNTDYDLPKQKKVKSTYEY